MSRSPFPTSPFSVGTVSAPGMGSAGCRTFVELKLSGALDAPRLAGEYLRLAGTPRFYGAGPPLYEDATLPQGSYPPTTNRDGPRLARQDHLTLPCLRIHRLGRRRAPEPWIARNEGQSRQNDADLALACGPRLCQRGKTIPPTSDRPPLVAAAASSTRDGPRRLL